MTCFFMAVDLARKKFSRRNETKNRFLAVIRNCWLFLRKVGDMGVWYRKLLVVNSFLLHLIKNFRLVTLGTK